MIVMPKDPKRAKKLHRDVLYMAEDDDGGTIKEQEARLIWRTIDLARHAWDPMLQQDYTVQGDYDDEGRPILNVHVGETHISSIADLGDGTTAVEVLLPPMSN